LQKPPVKKYWISETRRKRTIFSALNKRRD
jgi:hypothetical protein